MVKSEKKAPMTTAELAACALMAVVICVCSWISVPAPVPFTMQTFAVFCTLSLLGGRLGLISVAVYVLLGAVGLPVFSGFTGGIGKLLGPTGGYIAGFLLAAAVYWLLERWAGKSTVCRAAILALGLAVCYAFGTVWYIQVYLKGGGAVSLGGALAMCVFPFILPDAVKLALSLWVTELVKKHIRIGTGKVGW